MYSKRIDLRDTGVQLPTGDQWVDIPDSIFQVKTRSSDEFGVIHIRINPDYQAEVKPDAV